MVGGAVTATIRALTPGEWLHWAHVRGSSAPLGKDAPNEMAPKMSGQMMSGELGGEGSVQEMRAQIPPFSVGTGGTVTEAWAEGAESSPQPLANVAVRPVI